MSVPTTIISTANGPVIINQADYDPEIHVLWSPDSDQTQTGNSDQTQMGDSDQTQMGATTTAFVQKRGRKFFIVDSSGALINDADYDQKGYATEKDAWSVILGN